MTFSGTTQTDFMKLGAIPDRKKNQYIDYAGTDFYSKTLLNIFNLYIP